MEDLIPSMPSKNEILFSQNILNNAAFITISVTQACGDSSVVFS